MSRHELNGSVGLLARAMREVVREAAGEAVEPLRQDVAKVEKRLGGMEKEIRNLDAGLGKVRGEVSSVNKKVDVVGDQVQQMRRDLKQSGIPVQ